MCMLRGEWCVDCVHVHLSQHAILDFKLIVKKGDWQYGVILTIIQLDWKDPISK